MKIKFISCLLIVFVLSGFCFGFTAASIDLDGIMSENDWRNIEPEVIVTLSGESNCDVYFATVSVLAEESSNRLFFGFKVKVPGFSEESADYGVAVRINNDDFVYITPAAVTDYNNDKYSFEGVVHATSQTDFTAEIAIGVKYGLFTVENIEVRVVDSDGEPSNVYTLNVGEIITQAETAIQTPQFDGLEVIVPAENPTTQKQTTAKKTTTKKETTTKKPTTQKPTTTKKTTVADEEYDLQPTTKKIKTTKYKTVRTTQITTTDYITYDSTDIVETNQTTSFPYWYETTRRIPEGEETTVLTVNQLKIQKGFSYAAVAALILLALGICVVINLKNDKEHK